MAIPHLGTYAEFFKDKPKQDRGGGADGELSENPLECKAMPGVCVTETALRRLSESSGWS